MVICWGVSRRRWRWEVERTVDLDALGRELRGTGYSPLFNGDDELEIEFEVTTFRIRNDGMVLESDGTDMTEAVITIARHVAPAPTDALRAAAQDAIAAIHRSIPGIRPRQRPHDEPCGCVDCELWQAETTLRTALDGVPAPVSLTEAELRSLADAVFAATNDEMSVSLVLAKLRELRPELDWLVAK